MPPRANSENDQLEGQQHSESGNYQQVDLHGDFVPQKMPTEFASGLSTNDAGLPSVPVDSGEHYGGASTIVIGKQESFCTATGGVNVDGYGG